MAVQQQMTDLLAHRSHSMVIKNVPTHTTPIHPPEESQVPKVVTVTTTTLVKTHAQNVSGAILTPF
jgi:calcium/calmodulin-dependent protein kinase kinase 2